MLAPFLWSLQGGSTTCVCSDEGLTLETSAKHHIPQAKNISYQPLLIKPVFTCVKDNFRYNRFVHLVIYKLLKIYQTQFFFKRFNFFEDQMQLSVVKRNKGYILNSNKIAPNIFPFTVILTQFCLLMVFRFDKYTL